MAKKGRGDGYRAVGDAIDNAVRVRDVQRKTKARAEAEPPAEPPVLDPNEPTASAAEFIARRYTVDGHRTLHFHDCMFYAWNGICYPEADPQKVRADAYAFLDGAMRWDAKAERLVKFKPKQTKVNDFMDALRATTILDKHKDRPPVWLQYTPDHSLPADEILAVSNGLLHLPSLELRPPAPEFFTLNALEFAYRPRAAAPKGWLAFLRDLWPEDQQAIDTLQEVFGYCLTGDTQQQKIVLIVGPKRSGKGTIGRILTALVGADNVCNPTLASLGNNFGLEPLIGKMVALIGDARLGGRADQSAIAERLLSISGEDGITVDRKHRPAWTGRLSTRFIVSTNELPRVNDASGALASRFLIMCLTKSFYGHEDHGLYARLHNELPGILNWAIEGWRRLNKRGHFVQPNSSRQAMEDLEALGSPVSAFIRDRCDVDPGKEADIKVLYDAWRAWCEDQGRDYKGNVQNFGREMKAALPMLVQRQRPPSQRRHRYYEGIGLRPGVSRTDDLI